MWSVAQDTLQSASDWSSGPEWFRHHQHKLGQTGVGVGKQSSGSYGATIRVNCATKSVEFQVSRTSEQGSCQSVAQW